MVELLKSKSIILTVLFLALFSLAVIFFGDLLLAELLFLIALIVSLAIYKTNVQACLLKIVFFIAFYLLITFKLAIDSDNESAIVLSQWNIVTIPSLILYIMLILLIGIREGNSKKEFLYKLFIPLLLVALFLLIIAYITKSEIFDFPYDIVKLLV